VILLVLVVVLWIAVLVPGALKRRSEHRGAGSIAHFHHQLETLEHAGPKLMAPAYRLETAFPVGANLETSVPGLDNSRPKLVLLRPTNDQDAADVDDSEGCHYERVGVLSAPEPPERCLQPQAELAALRRQEARTRCTYLLRTLVGVVLLTAIIGALPGLHLAWISTGIFGLAALGLLGLIGYAREVEAERQRRIAARARWAAEEFEYATAPPASDGYPGAWDEEFAANEEPRRVAAGR
jgi:hypothetical protein